MKAIEKKDTDLAIERFGWVTKEEPLSCVADLNINLNICILEAVSPFFGYYADQPRTSKPQYLYWFLERHYPMEHIARAVEHIRQNFNRRIDGACGQIYIMNKSYPVIRMLNLGQYNQITKVQAMFENMGIHLKKGATKIHNQMGLIQLNKFLHLKPVDEGIYLDNDSTHRGFFVIPRFVDWEEFKSITTEVKYDTSLIFFDAARTAFMEQGKIVDMVRIYRENLTIEKLIAIRDRYLKFIY